MKTRYLYLAFAALLFLGCTNIIQPLEETQGVLVFKASNGDNLETKTVLQADGTIMWSASDEINLFYGSAHSAKFTSTNTEPAKSVVFKGALTGFEYNDTDRFWAIYPYNEANTCDGNSVTVLLPSQQTAVAGTFEDDLFIGVAQTKDLNLTFYNVCGGVKFNVTKEGVKTVTFKGNNGESLAGTAKVQFGEDGKPTVVDITNPQTEIILKAPESATFEVGKWYYIVAFPSILSAGYSISMETVDNAIANITTTTSARVKRSIWGTLDQLDETTDYNYPVTDISLNKASLDLLIGENETLVATVKPDNASDKTVTWTSSAPDVATVDETGKVTAVKTGETTITAKAGEKEANCIVTVRFGIIAVDLGLSVLWANANIGAEEPSKRGSLYAWGEIEVKEEYRWENYIWNPGKKGSELDDSDMIKYNKIDRMTELEMVDDVAHKVLGETWRLPTMNEASELFGTMDDKTNYKWTWTKENGIYGQRVEYLVNGNSIFLPAAGGSNDASARCTFWTASLSQTFCMLAWKMETYQSLNGCNPDNRYVGYPIRPVKGIVNVASISLNKETLELKLGNSEELFATVKPDNAFDKTVIWTTSNNSVAEVDNNGKVTALKEGNATITAKAGDVSATCEVTVNNPPDGAIDLGIVMTREDGSTYKLYWAECNLGASTPEDYGDYYAWGEVETKSDYSWSTYKWANGAENKITKYCSLDWVSYWDGAGNPDEKKELDPEDDVAHVKLGGKWRMPTKAELEALVNTCEWSYTQSNGKYGYYARSKVNSNVLFLPFSGSYRGTELENIRQGGGIYSTTLYDGWSGGAVSLGFRGPGGVEVGFCERYGGISIRPVSE